MNPTTENLLQEIETRIQQSKSQYMETGNHFFLGEMTALDSLRNFIRLSSQQSPEEPGFISLADVIEPNDAVLDRILMKVGEIGGSLKSINSLAMAIC